jgi:hypothetical protein
MGIIVGMSQCMVDVSKSDFILMIGRQLLFLGMILFVLCFGSLPISPSIPSLVPLIADKESKTSDSASSISSASTISSAIKTINTISTPSSLSRSSRLPAFVSSLSTFEFIVIFIGCFVVFGLLAYFISSTTGLRIGGGRARLGR